MDGYRSAEYKCPSDEKLSFNCGSMLLGGLSRELQRLKILSPRPETPFNGMSYEVLQAKDSMVCSPVWHSNDNKGYANGFHPALGKHQCSIALQTGYITCILALTVRRLELQG